MSIFTQKSHLACLCECVYVCVGLCLCYFLSQYLANIWGQLRRGCSSGHWSYRCHEKVQHCKACCTVRLYSRKDRLQLYDLYELFLSKPLPRLKCPWATNRIKCSHLCRIGRSERKTKKIFKPVKPHSHGGWHADAEHEFQGVGIDLNFVSRERKTKMMKTPFNQSHFASAATLLALCEEASSGSVWKQDVGRRAGHLPHAMEPLEIICIGYVCVCVCTSVWFVAGCPMKSLCACVSA